MHLFIHPINPYSNSVSETVFPCRSYEKQAHKLKMPVGLLLFRSYLVLLSQQITAPAPSVRGQAACRVKLTVIAVNRAGLYQRSHGLDCPACHVAAVSEALRILPLSVVGSLLSALSALQQHEHFLSGDGLFGANLLSPTPLETPLALAAAR